VIEQGIAEGWRTYDFLAGFSEHKRRWQAKERDGFDLLLARRGTRGELALALGLWPTGRYLRLREVRACAGPASEAEPVHAVRTGARAAADGARPIPVDAAGPMIPSPHERCTVNCQLVELPAAGRAWSRLGVFAARGYRTLARWTARALRALEQPGLVARALRVRLAPGAETPHERVRPLALDLEPGERVRVLPLDRIRATLDAEKRCDGLAFMGLMGSFCGRSFTVRRRVNRFFDERTRRMLSVRNVVLLDGVYCEPPRDGCDDFAGCERSCFLFWKEAWLERERSA
jgi:hypothetical protein